MLDPTQIMSRREIATVPSNMHRKAKHSRLTHQNLIIFRLTIGAGLRCSEVAKLEIRDLHLTGARPHILIRKALSKTKRSRKVPLWWDQGTLDALLAWRDVRVENMGAGPQDPVVCVMVKIHSNGLMTKPGMRARLGRPLARQQIATKWRSAVRCLGPDRQRELHTHSGRHTFASYMVHERSLPEVRDALGHSSLAMTSIYLHVRPEDMDRRGSVFKLEYDEPEEVTPDDQADQSADQPPKPRGAEKPVQGRWRFRRA